MSNDSLEYKLISFLVDSFYLEQEDIDIDTPLFSSNILDSFNMIEVVTYLEQITDQTIPAMDLHLDNLDTVSKMVMFLKAKNGQ